MKKKWIASALALCMALLPLTGCQKHAPGQTTAAQQPDRDDGSLVTLTASLPAQGKNRTWGMDEISEEVTRLTNVQLDIQWYRSDDDIKAQLAAGELADITAAYTHSLGEIEDTKYLLPWDELAPQYTPKFWDTVSGETLALNRAADGHIYTLRGWPFDEAYYKSNVASEYYSTNAMAYRTDLAKRLELSSLSSLEDFEDVLYEVKDRADELGVEYVFYVNGTMRNDSFVDSEYNMHRTAVADWMGVKQDRWWDEEAKMVRLPYRDENWLPYLKKMNQWYRDGILHYMEMGTMYAGNNFQIVSQLEQALPKTFAFSWSASFLRDMNISIHHRGQGGDPTDPTKPSITLHSAPLSWEGEIRTRYVDHYPGVFGTYIANTCKNPQAAMEFLAFTHSESGDNLLCLGIEGTHYDMTGEGLPKYREDYLYKKDSELVKFTSSFVPYYWKMLGSGKGYHLYTGSHALNEEDDIDRITTQALLDFWQDRKDRTVRDPAMIKTTITTADAEYETLTAMRELWNNTLGQLIQAESAAAVEQSWTELQEKLDAMGMEKIENLLTGRYLTHAKVFAS